MATTRQFLYSGMRGVGNFPISFKGVGKGDPLAGGVIKTPKGLNSHAQKIKTFMGSKTKIGKLNSPK